MKRKKDELKKNLYSEAILSEKLEAPSFSRKEEKNMQQAFEQTHQRPHPIKTPARQQIQKSQ